MIGSIGSSSTAIAMQSVARRSAATAFANIRAGAESAPAVGSIATQRPASPASLQKSGPTDGKAIDFTHMTRSELRDVIRSKIRSGELSIDGTEAFVVMMGASEAEQAGRVDMTQIDFMQSVRDQMAFSRQHGDTAWLRRLETTLGTMSRYQGQTGGMTA